MGQYYVVANLTKREFIHPHALGDGLKLMEFASGGLGGVASALCVLLAASNGRGGGDFGRYDATPEQQQAIAPIAGRWAGDRIAAVGDYTEPGDLPPEDKPEWIYTLCLRAERRAEHRHPAHTFNWIAKHRLNEEDAARFKAECTPEDLYTDISPLVRRAFRLAEGVRYDGSAESWLDRRVPGEGTPQKYMRPDMVVGLYRAGEEEA